MRDFTRPRNLIYALGGVALLVWPFASGFDTEKLSPFIVWSCGGGLLLDYLDKRSERKSSR